MSKIIVKRANFDESKKRRKDLEYFQSHSITSSSKIVEKNVRKKLASLHKNNLFHNQRRAPENKFSQDKISCRCQFILLIGVF